MPTTDIHTHLIPPLPDTELTAVGLEFTGGVICGAHGPIGPPQIGDPGALVSWMDRAGIDRAAVSTPPPLYRQHLAEDASTRWVRALNVGLAGVLGDEPCLMPLGYLPLEHPAVARRELERLLVEGVVPGVTGAAGGRSVSLDAPELDALWGLCSEADLPVLLHPAASPDERLKPHYLENLLGNPVETSIAAGQLVFGAVLARYPRLRVGLVHAGGAIAAVAGRWRRGVATSRPGVSIDGDSFERSLRALWVDSLAHDPSLLAHAAGIVGVDHVLLGSDWPFPMGSDDPVGDVLSLGDAATRIGGDNARAFFGTRADHGGLQGGK